MQNHMQIEENAFTTGGLPLPVIALIKHADLNMEGFSEKANGRSMLQDNGLLSLLVKVPDVSLKRENTKNEKKKGKGRTSIGVEFHRSLKTVEQ